MSGIHSSEIGNRSRRAAAAPALVARRAGTVLRHLDDRQMLAVPVQSGTTLVAGRPQVLFESAIFAGSGWLSAVRHRRRWTVRDHPSGQADAGGGTRRT